MVCWFLLWSAIYPKVAVFPLEWWLKSILVSLLIDKVEDQMHILRLRVVQFLWIIH